MRAVHLAQVNIGRMKGPLESATMAGFVARLDEHGPTPFAFNLRVTFPPEGP